MWPQGKGSFQGEHVAGIAAANSSEGDTLPEGRVDGIAPNAQLLAMKVIDEVHGLEASDMTFDSDLVAAIEDSVKLGADVINMSLGTSNGFSDPSSGTIMAIQKAQAQGVMVVVSAGNKALQFGTGSDTSDRLGIR